ncbi:ABC-2 family transporter protein [Paenibacillus sp. MCAF20]
MVSSIKHYVSVASCFARLAVQRQLEYPLFLFSWLLMIPIQYFSGIWMLKIIVDRFQPLNGWDFPQLTFLYGLGLISHGIFVVIDCIPGVIIFIYGCEIAGFEWSLVNVGKLILVLIGGILIRAALFTSLGAIAFWTKRNGSMVGFALTMLERATMYPLSMYPYFLQALFTFVIPIGFISFYPAAEFLGTDNGGLELPLSFALWTPAVGLACFLLASVIFRYGMKNYESAGS